ncbi:MAG: glutathione-disulfide reductase [Polyangiaceae bacterium]|nr:glutathione-disulfide reductase [Polyangiaceae bacterium]
MSDAAFDFDLFVIGAGSGGVRASRMAAAYGARVGVCESAALGGTCVNVGCVPKKLMVYGAHFHDEWRDATGFGWRVDPPTFDWATLIANKDREIARLNGIYERLLVDRGVRIVRGHGVIEGPNRVTVTSEAGERTTFTAKNILIAVGGKPSRPQIPGGEHVLVSDDVFHLAAMPRRILIVGGGYIAVEFAGVFAGFGSIVTQIHRGPLFLRGFDRDVRVHLEQEMRKRGIDLRFRRSLARVEELGGGVLQAHLDDGSTIEVDAVLAAIGREPRTSGLGLETAGIEADKKGAIRVNRRFRTSVPSIYAIGDVIDRIQLTPVALSEGMIVAGNLFGGQRGAADYDNVPSAVFSSPPIGSVGLTEEQARAEVGAVDCYMSTFRSLKLTMTDRTERTLMKLVVDRASQRVLGVHMVGADAGEIVQGFAVALKCGATKAQFDATIGIHPTSAEEFVTMRERCPEPDHDLHVAHEEAVRDRRVVYHRWQGDDD